MHTLRATRLRKKRSCSEMGNTRGPSVVMFAFSACPAMDIRSFDKYTPAQQQHATQISTAPIHL